MPEPREVGQSEPQRKEIVRQKENFAELRIEFEIWHAKVLDRLLVAHVSYELVAGGASKLADGRDDGRDAKFVGRAGTLPSLPAP